MKVYIISFTEKGDRLNDMLCLKLGDWQISSYPKREKRLPLAQWTDMAFKNSDAIIFIGAAGIAVRAIASFIESKAKDPAVVVCDELGKYAIPILSGHIGGGNELALKIEQAVGAIPVITTATDINNVWAVDTWAVKKGFKIYNTENIKYISSALLKGEQVGIVSDIELNKNELPPQVVWNTDTQWGIVVSPIVKKVYRHTLNLIPKCISVGAGSRKNSDENALIKLLNRVLSENNIDKYSIKTVSTIDIKSQETAILSLCDDIGVKLKCYSAHQLNDVEGEFTCSEFVRKITGTDNVCERCALLSSDGGRLIVKKTAENGVTLALAAGKEA